MLDFTKHIMDKTQNHTYNDLEACRVAAYFVQNGRCYVTDTILKAGQRELHHRKPRKCDGKDEPENLILLAKAVHKMVHASNQEEFNIYWNQIPLTEEQLLMLNHLRVEAYEHPMKREARRLS